jgi:hypothetical protein
MISAAEARELANNISQLQLEEIERGIKQTIILGGHAIYYTTDKLEQAVINTITKLGYKIQPYVVGGFTTCNTEISWEA